MASMMEILDSSETFAELRAERDALKAEVEYERTGIEGHNERLAVERDELKTANETLRAEVIRLAYEKEQLSASYDLLHKRIEAYDETHALLSELSDAAERCRRAWTSRGYGDGPASMVNLEEVLNKIRP